MSQQILPGDLSQIDTVARCPLGTLYIDNLGNHYRYMQADGAVVAYDLYTYVPGTWQIDAQADATVNPADAHVSAICVHERSSTDLADNEYAWVFVGPGTFSVDVDANGYAGAEDIAYVSATAGKASSTATALFLPGVFGTAAIAADATGTLYASIPLYAVDAA